MKLTADDIRHVARLARIELDGADTEKYLEELGKILGYVDQLGQLETEGVPPTTAVGASELPRRGDEPRPCLSAETLLASAPARQGGHFRVPSVVDP